MEWGLTYLHEKQGGYDVIWATGDTCETRVCRFFIE